MENSKNSKNSKIAERKPLEVWLNIYEYSSFFESKEEAEENAAPNLLRTVLFREVEEDQKTPPRPPKKSGNGETISKSSGL